MAYHGEHKSKVLKGYHRMSSGKIMKGVTHKSAISKRRRK